ncbi:TetR family transcriptional regulator protein [Tolypothrix tenuis PCC 7101]|uniref:TetR family transcriptional regulator protein n=1 Tax=Tolypothrix tenuis PCC 7101 TaxID=231146 RepID=A0A1Z4N0F4_9CYAN|nr:TetR/AcrR family transcriptional regulator [Aulosira sp. FACHB-113]BAY99218.1 TetR family transcriptional regulator protein [Tolypothrix tenuis PCC 7101]BAZ76859.1 TetR family transcriptional regulator protein [Aulosira laxa NIES-50]
MPDDRNSPKQVSSSGRERILDEAEHLFHTRGYNTVTMRDIAQAVGIRQASLYYHFPSKEQLFVAVTERMFERHRLGLQQTISENEDNLRSQLSAVGAWFISQPPIHFLSMVHTDMPLLDAENTARLSACSSECIFDPICQIFAQAQQRGEIRNVRPQLLAGFFLSVIESLPFATTFANAAPKEFIVNEMIAVLLDGLMRD